MAKLTLAIVGIFLIGNWVTGQVSEHYTVCPENCPFRSIQSAIDRTSEGSTITIGPGTYRENLRISKDVRLVGKNQSEVKLQALNERVAIIGVQTQQPIQLFLQSITIGDPSRPISNWKEIPTGAGIEIDGPVQALLRRVTIYGRSAGISATAMGGATAHDLLRFLPEPHIVLDGVELRRNFIGVHAVSYDSFIIANSIVEENWIGFLGEKILLNKSVVRQNTVGVWLVTRITSPEPMGELDSNEIKKNLVGVYLEALYDGSQIVIQKNQIMENQQYGILVSDPACSVDLGRGSYVGPKNALITIFGGDNEAKDNPKGYLCPKDYAVPPWFIKK